MKLLCIPMITAICLCFAINNLASQTSYGSSYTTIPSFSDEDIIERLNKLSNPLVRPRFDNIVRSYVNTYTVRHRTSTQEMLGRAVMYFPIFEKHLREQNMPLELKYLPVLESALKPHATSRSKAEGLWQFMEFTGKDNGLNINRYVDERRDPNKATLAAIKFLGALYKRYQNWELALAAYNGGPGRVSKAIKKARSTDFDRVAKYLPKETRNYVPAFIAACYILNYYQLHGLSPIYPDPDFQLTSTIKLYEPINFERIQQITGVSIEKIRTLNPSYKKDFFPSSHVGNYLILPQNAMGYMLSYLGRSENQIEQSSGISSLGNDVYDHSKYIKSSYIVQNGDNLESLSGLLKCSILDMKKWNNLVLNDVASGRKLTIYQPINAVKRNVASLSFLPTRKITPFLVETKKKKDLPLKSLKSTASIKHNNHPKAPIRSKTENVRGKYVFYQIRRRDTLLEIASKYPDVTLDDILALNGLNNFSIPKAGTKIKIKKI